MAKLFEWPSGFCAVLLLAVGWSTAQASEPSGEPMLRIEAGMHTAKINRISTDEAGRYAVTASDDKTARVWERATGKLVQVLRPPQEQGNEGKLFAVAMSPDGSSVAVGGLTGWDWYGKVYIYIFDRASGRLLRRLGGLPRAVNHLAFSRNGRWLAGALGGKSGVRVWDLAGSSDTPLADSDYGDSSYCVAWSKDGRLAATSWDGKLHLYRPVPGKLEKLAETSTSIGKQLYGVAFSPDGRRLAVGYNDRPVVEVFDAATLAVALRPDLTGVANGSLSSVAWSADGSTLYAGGAWQHNGLALIRAWANAGHGVPRNVPTAGSTITDLQATPDAGLLVAVGDPAWGVLGTDWRWQPLGVPPTADFRGGRQSFAVDATGNLVQFGYEYGGKQPHQFDVRGRNLLIGSDKSLPLPRIEGLDVQDWKNTDHPTLSGRLLPLDKNEFSRSLAIAPDASRFALGTEWYLRLFSRSGTELWKQPVAGTVWGVSISSSGRVVVAAYGDGTIRWHRISDGKEVLALFLHADRKRWVLWTPSGYFDASAGGEDMIGWHINRGADQAADFFPASRFRSQFYRPDVVEHVLDTLDEGEALRQANAAASRKPEVIPVSVAQVLPPVVSLLAPVDGTVLSSTSVTLRYSVHNPTDAPVVALRVRVNGQPVNLSETRNLSVQASGVDAVHELTVSVPSQDSEIMLFAENKNGVSTPAITHVVWKGSSLQVEKEAMFKPKLYVLAVGVSKYKNPDFNLALASKDARDFAAVFQKQKGKLYSEVTVRLLTDDNATKDDVLDGLEWLKREVTSRDVGVMFLAGHGTNDNTGNYYFLPHNADLTQLLRTGVANNDIKLTLNSLAGKALFFVDTCHSGNALGTAKTRGVTDVNAFVNELASAENGVVVFTASTGRQLSQESPDWGNGAFTKAVVEGLSGKADFQKNGKITHKGLDYYVTERVKELTKGQQSPVSISPQGVTDFPVAVTGEFNSER